LAGDALFKSRGVRRCGSLVLREKQHSRRERPLRRKSNASLRDQKGARYSCQDTHTVTAFAIGSDSAAVRQARQRGQSKPQDVMIGCAAQGRNKANSARLVIEARIEEGLASGSHGIRSHNPL